ncbi:hypothetical protein ACET3Z_013173 [Daucus carota]
MLKDQMICSSRNPVYTRDENGLPVLSNLGGAVSAKGDPFKDKMKNKLDESNIAQEPLGTDKQGASTEGQVPSPVCGGSADVNARVAQDDTTSAIPDDEVSWTEVRRKKSAPVDPEVSPSPPRTFKNLRNVDEVDKRKANGGGSPARLTKSQKKKLRLQKGSSPSSNP